MDDQRLIFFVIYKSGTKSATYRKDYGFAAFYNIAVPQDKSFLFTAQQYKADGISICEADTISYKPVTLFVHKLGEKYLRAYQSLDQRSDKYFSKDCRMNDEVLFVYFPEKQGDFSDWHKIYHFVDKLNKSTFQKVQAYTPPNIFYLGPKATSIFGTVGVGQLPKSIIVQLDHGEMTLDPTGPYFDPNQGEKGVWVDRTPVSLRPYRVQMDHGETEYDPTKPYFDPNQGETGAWVNPGVPYTPPFPDRG